MLPMSTCTPSQPLDEPIVAQGQGQSWRVCLDVCMPMDAEDLRSTLPAQGSKV